MANELEVEYHNNLKLLFKEEQRVKQEIEKLQKLRDDIARRNTEIFLDSLKKKIPLQ